VLSVSHGSRATSHRPLAPLLGNRVGTFERAAIPLNSGINLSFSCFLQSLLDCLLVSICFSSVACIRFQDASNSLKELGLFGQLIPESSEHILLYETLTLY